MKRNPCPRILCLVLAAAVLCCGIQPLCLADGDDEQYIVKYSEDRADLLDPERASPFGVVSAAELRKLLAGGCVEWYEEDGDAQLLDVDAEAPDTEEPPYYEQDQWNLEMTDADAAFSREYLGQGVRIGVIDSGIAPHPALEGRLMKGRNYILGADDPDDTVDTLGHGTKVAGLIAGGDEGGYIGAAPMAQLVPLKCTDGKSVKISAICEAIYGGIDDFGCRVLNLSLSASREYDSLRDAVRYAAEKDVLIVSAAGNSTESAYPAMYDTVVGVGSVDMQGNHYKGSNSLPGSVFITAPGTGLRSLSVYGGYSYGITGTSFSTPQASAAAAVMLSIDGSLTPRELAAILADTACDTGEEGYDRYYGHGVLNIGGCVAALAGEAVPGDVCSLCSELESGPADTVHNNSDHAMTCLLMTSLFDEDGRFLSLSMQRITLRSGESARFSDPGEAHLCMQTVLSKNMIPLGAALKSDLQNE